MRKVFKLKMTSPFSLQHLLERKTKIERSKRLPKIIANLLNNEVFRIVDWPVLKTVGSNNSEVYN